MNKEPVTGQQQPTTGFIETAVVTSRYESDSLSNCYAETARKDGRDPAKIVNEVRSKDEILATGRRIDDADSRQEPRRDSHLESRDMNLDDNSSRKNAVENRKDKTPVSVGCSQRDGSVAVSADQRPTSCNEETVRKDCASAKACDSCDPGAKSGANCLDRPLPNLGLSDVNSSIYKTSTNVCNEPVGAGTTSPALISSVSPDVSAVSTAVASKSVKTKDCDYPTSAVNATSSDVNVSKLATRATSDSVKLDVGTAGTITSSSSVTTSASELHTSVTSSFVKVGDGVTVTSASSSLVATSASELPTSVTSSFVKVGDGLTVTSASSSLVTTSVSELPKSITSSSSAKTNDDLTATSAARDLIDVRCDLRKSSGSLGSSEGVASISSASSCPPIMPKEKSLSDALPHVVQESGVKTDGGRSLSRLEASSAGGGDDFAFGRSAGNVKQRYSDIPKRSEGLCVGESLDREIQSCMELSQDSESLKNLTEDKTASVVKSEVPSCVSAIQPVSIAEVGKGDRGSDTSHDRHSADDPLLKNRYDRRSVTSISSDSRAEVRSDLPSIGPGCIIMSQSTEKITGRPTNTRMQFFPGGGIVRSSRSQENYFDSGDITCVDIDLDDNIASSVDALHYDTSSMASLDSMGIPDWPIDGSETDLYLHTDRSSKNVISAEPDSTSLPTTLTPSETHSTSSTVKNGLPESSVPTKLSQALQAKSKPTTTSRAEDQRCGTGHGIATSINASDVEGAFDLRDRGAVRDNSASNIPDLTSEAKHAILVLKGVVPSPNVPTLPVVDSAVRKDVPGEQLTNGDVLALVASGTAKAGDALEEDEDEDDDEQEDLNRNDDLDFMFRDEAFFRQPTKDVDRPSAARLAKRLFYLHGFKKSDVSRHLSKKNSFSQLVGEEYLKYFDFTGESLDGSLRRFMRHMTIYGETQDRERLLAHFSCRYHNCNLATFRSEDCCHTLACALLLLNNDLHGQNIGRKITLAEFVSNLADMNDGDQFPRELLKTFYVSIKNQPLEFEAEELRDPGGSASSASAAAAPTSAQTQSRFVSYNPFYEIPDPSNAVEFKKGYVMRKCCLEPDGRKTPLGKRGWKMFYATLRDMVLHLHIDEHGFKRNLHYTSATNSIHIHHSLATKATDYQKKNHVFRLQTADLAQYLIQTSDSKECQEWIDAINFVAASYSAPAPVSSITSQKRFQRPLMPSTYTRLNLRDQINHHEKMIAEFDRELVEHRKNPPEKGAKTRLIQDYCKKENYLKFELKRYKTYCRLLQYKVSTFPELEPSLAEIAIGEVDETVSSNSPVESPFDGHAPKFFQSPTEAAPRTPDRVLS